jgi:hypothetical protein
MSFTSPSEQPDPKLPDPEPNPAEVTDPRDDAEPLDEDQAEAPDKAS